MCVRMPLRKQDFEPPYGDVVERIVEPIKEVAGGKGAKRQSCQILLGEVNHGGHLKAYR